MALTAVFSVPAAMASCTRLNPGDQDLTASMNVPNIDRADYPFARLWTGLVVGGYQCSAGRPNFVVNAPLTGLTYVKDIFHNGENMKAYRATPRGPLVAFALNVRDSPSMSYGGPSFGLGTTVLPPREDLGGGPVDLSIFIHVFLPGGAIEGVPMTDFGTITTSVEGDPSQSMQHHIRFEFVVAPITCTLASTSHTLAAVSADELAQANSTAGESAFNVDMNCPAANVDVHLSMADANNPVSVDGQLQPASGSTASGVQVQLLRGGVPLQFGQTWAHGLSSKGLQQIPFSARYRRMPGNLAPGAIKGEAVLTADYR